jgi:hypothetical protein
MEWRAEQKRSQTQEKRLAMEKSVAVMLPETLCSPQDNRSEGVTLSGWKKWAYGQKKVQDDTKDVRRY